MQQISGKAFIYKIAVIELWLRLCNEKLQGISKLAIQKMTRDTSWQDVKGNKEKARINKNLELRG